MKRFVLIVTAAWIGALMLSLVFSVTPWTPSAHAAAMVNTDAVCASVSDIDEGECRALVALYTSADGANWSDNTNWLSGSQACAWAGVLCNEGHVVELYLPNNGLKGTLPRELGNLTHIEFFDVSFNQMHGQVPRELASLSNLQEIYLNDSGLNGSLNDAFAELTDLNVLDISDTNLCVASSARSSTWLAQLDQEEEMPTVVSCEAMPLEIKFYLPFVSLDQ
ncbi:MAG: hypothetical protein R3C14_25560 [Caldilineaceae bacterium]